MMTFGTPEPGAQYQERRAAYAVIEDGQGRFAAVAGPVNDIAPDAGSARYALRQRFFLPGGGSLPYETPEETVVREVTEELGQRVRLLFRIGEATQYFYSDTDARHYRMVATFFAATFPEGAGNGSGEHFLHWLPVTDAPITLFHACHAWAVTQN